MHKQASPFSVSSKDKQRLKKIDRLFMAGEYAEVLKELKDFEKSSRSNAENPYLKKDITNYRGMIAHRAGEWGLAEKHFLASLEACNVIGEPRFIFNRYDNLATVYLSMENRVKAIEYLQKSIALKEESHSEKEITRGLVQLADLQLSLENTAAAEDVLHRAKYLIAVHKQPQYLMYWHFTNGMKFKRLKEFSKAFREYKKAISFAGKFGDAMLEIHALNNASEIGVQAGFATRSLEYARRGLQLAEEKKLLRYQILFAAQLARISLDLNKPMQSRSYLDKVLSGPREYFDDMLQRNVAEISARLLTIEGKPQQALEAYTTYVEKYRRFYDSELSKTVLDLQARYEAERKERELQQLKTKQAEGELKLLRAQMDPHFVFNVLNSLRLHLLQGNLEDTDELLVRFSRLMRLMLNNMRRPWVSLDENIELLKLYIELERSRLSSRFNYVIKIGKGVKASMEIPAVVLQPLVENVIKHAMFPRTDNKGKMAVNFMLCPRGLKVKVSDNGTGKAQSAIGRNDGHQSHALDIIRETLEIIWGGSGFTDYFEIKAAANKGQVAAGTEVIITLPVKTV